MGNESLLDHYNKHEFGWNIRMLLLGFINNVGLGVMLAFLGQLSSNYDRNLQFAQFTVAVMAVPILARFLNAYFFIQTLHDIRVFLVACFFIVSYIFLTFAFIFPDEQIGIPFASLAVIIYSFARSIGESTIVGYIKAIPQELVCTFGTGTGMSDCFQSLTTLIILHFGMDSVNYALFLAVLIVPYFMFF